MVMVTSRPLDLPLTPLLILLQTDFASGSAPVAKGTFHAERAVFFGRWDHFPHHLVPVSSLVSFSLSSPSANELTHFRFDHVLMQLYTKTYTLFDSLQQIAEQEQMRREEAGGSSSA